MEENLKQKVMITAALVGTITPKSSNPAIPITPQELADDAYACWKAGASIVHLHMRDDNGEATMETERFRETIKLIRARKDCDVIIDCTSSGTLLFNSTESRLKHFKEVPGIEIGSFDAGTFNWACHHVFDNNPQFLEALAACYKEKGIKPEIEIFDTGMISTCKQYLKTGVLEGPCYYQFCMGIIGGMDSTVENLVDLKHRIPEGSVWSAFGVGKGHLPVMYGALALGGHIRVGLEDNNYMSKGVLATNVSLVERAVRAVETFGKEVATSAEARRILGLPQLDIEAVQMQLGIA